MSCDLEEEKKRSRNPVRSAVVGTWYVDASGRVGRKGVPGSRSNGLLSQHVMGLRG